MLQMWREAPLWKMSVMVAIFGHLVMWMFYAPQTQPKPRPPVQQGQVQPQAQPQPAWSRSEPPAQPQPVKKDPIAHQMDVIRGLAAKDPLMTKP